MPRISYSSQQHRHYARYLWDCLPEGMARVTALTGGYVFLIPFQAEFPVTIDRLIHLNATVSTGNFRLGFYEDNGDTPVGGALIAESISVATTGVNTRQETIIVPVAPFTNLQLATTLYWLAIQKDTPADTQITHDIPECIGGTLQSYCYAQAYGAFTNPCPAVALYNYGPILGVRVASVP